MIKIKRYKIKKRGKENDVMLTEKLLGFNFPVTKRSAALFNQYADEVEKEFNRKPQKRKSYAQELFEEIIEIAATKKIAIEED